MVTSAFLLACFGAWPGSAPAQETGFGGERTQSFSIPAAHTARALQERIEGHIAAERWSDAIADIQTMIEEHRGYVLGGRREDRNGQRSQFALHPGAAEEARERLLSLPAEALQLYADRYGPQADAALEQGRRALDRAALVEVARRWPATEAGPRAWFSLGDLELELGNVDAACGAWQRGVAALERLGRELPPSATARLELCAAEPSGEDTSELDDGTLSLRSLTLPPAQLRLPGPADERGSLPTSDCDSWTRSIDESREGPLYGSSPSDHFNLFPVLYEDIVLVSTSLRLLAFDAFSGALLWRTPEPPGWTEAEMRPTIADDGSRVTRNDFFEGINRKTLMVAPAASGGIVVAALQIPVTTLGNTAFQHTIDITRVIPDRRLFAFDVHTGRELWNHMPPPLWDGESGNFAQRMRVAGPPVISGTRIVVPMYRPQGRIDYHVACFDLVSGRRLWSRAIISGQVPLNMFGRPEEEYAAPPLRVEGERVVAVTQLGAIAALDLYTGDILWESLYDQIALPGAEGFSASLRPAVWKNAPPVVAGDVVIATPRDSFDLLGLDLKTGAVRWSFPQRRITEGTTRGYNRNLPLALIGATADSVYLAGKAIYDVRALNDYRGGPLRHFRSAELQTTGATKLPRPALGARHVVVPTSDRRAALDLFDLRLEDPQFSGDWGSAGMAARGNCLIANGALFTLSGRSLTALFDWKEAEERLTREFERDPFDYRAATQLGNFLARRGTVEWEKQRYRSALENVREARSVLAPLLERSADIAAAEQGGLRARLHEVHMLEARILMDDLQPDRALTSLDAAVALAPDDERLLDALLETATILDGRDRERWFATLELLERECGELAYSDTHAREEEPNPDTVERSTRSSGRARPSGSSPKKTVAKIRVAQWVLLQRARAYSVAGELSEELETLHSLLERFGDVEVSANEVDRTPERVSERIRARIEKHGREAYAPFEARARSLLDEARRNGTQEAFEEVTRLYPFSLAGEEARTERLQAALDVGDVATVADITLRSLPSGWTLASSAPGDVQLVLQLARALEGVGNERYARTVLERLARYHGRQPGDAETEQTIDELARALPEQLERPFPGEQSDFGVPTEGRTPVSTNNASLGPLAPSDCAEGEVRWAFVLPEQILVFSSQAVEREVWSFPIDIRNPAYFAQQHCVIRPGRIVIVDDRHDSDILIGIDAKSGLEAWRWSTEYKVHGLFEDGGVVVAILTANQATMAVALDTHAGVELWRRELPAELGPTTPVFGEGRMVLLGRTSAPQTMVIELATGTVGVPIDFRETPPSDDRTGCWIENNSLILPRFSRAGRGGDEWVVAYNLDTGVERWTLRGDGLRELHSIAKSGPDTYLILNGTGSGRNASGQILQLDTRLGSQRTVSDSILSIDDDPIGLLPRRVTQLNTPYLFLRSVSPTTGQVLIRAIHLPYGERWTHTLPLKESELYTSSMPLPALSQTTVAVVYKKRGRSPESHLLLLDRTRGTRREQQILDRGFDANRTMRLVPLGPALFLSSRKQIGIITRTEPR